MKKNMGIADRIIRLLAAAVIGYLYYTGEIDGIWGAALVIIGIVFVLTSLMGVCPLYTLLRINTCRTKSSHE